MIKRTLQKNIFREIKGTLSRFLAIFAIAALGAGFFAGLKATGPDMQATGNRYFENQKLADWRLVSTMGFTNADIETLRRQPEVESVMAGYGTDALVQQPDDSTAVVRLHSLPDETSADNEAYLNQLVLTEGRLPTRANECMADSESGHKVGDVVTLSDENSETTLGQMAHRRFTVVGLGRSPLYIAFQRGNTTIGNGRLAYFLYLHPSAFSGEVYTEVFVRAAGQAGLSAFDEPYKTLLEEGDETLADFGGERARLRYDELAGEGERELQKAEGTLATARAEAQQQLSEAKQLLEEKQSELNRGQSQLAAGKRQLDAAAAQLAAGQNTLAENQRNYEAGLAAWQQANGQYQSGLAAWQQGNAQYNAAASGFAAIQSSAGAATASLATLQQLLGEIGAGTSTEEQQAIQSFQAEGATAVATLRTLAGQLSAAGMAGEAQQVELAAAGIEGLLAASQYAAVVNVLQQLTGALQPGLQQAQGQLAATLARLNSEKQKLDAGKQTLDETKARLDAGAQQLEAARTQLAAGEAQYNQSSRQLASAQLQLNQGAVQLAEGWQTYQSEAATATARLDSAQAEIDEGRSRLAALSVPEWFVFSRADNPGYTGFESDTRRIDAIAVVIPVFFFLVAALVCLTTMTRMVEEQRTQIGTLKALGFSRGAIASKYLFYAAAASFFGGAAGVAVGFVLFPNAIWNAYRMMYLMPSLSPANNSLLAILSVAACVLCTTLATLAACLGALRSVPAQLMRPKAPRPGQRVLLERLPKLWNRVSFSWKVALRNLFRYKKRFIMTVVGVAGCAALLLTGFGLQDSINGLVEMQFGSISKYHMTAALSEPSNAEQNSELNELVGTLGGSLYVQQTSFDAMYEGNTNAGMTTYLYVPENPAGIDEFLDLRNRQSGEALALGNNGVVITEKLAKKLDAEEGDTIEFGYPNETKKQVQVTGVAENYVFNYIYITPTLYTELFGAAPEYNQVLLRLDEPYQSEQAQEQVLGQLVEQEGVASAFDIEALSSQMDDLLQSLNSVVWLIIVSAASLAFVVLYNLTNINITERAREIATLKVLGFHKNEVSSYIFRENILLTVIGIAVGMLLGVVLHDFVITTAEVDEVMFRRVILPLSYLWSALFTLGCTLVVNLVMGRRLQRIDMVESLKSAE